MASSPEKLRQMEAQNPAKQYFAAFVSGLVLVYILAHFVQYTKARTAGRGFKCSFAAHGSMRAARLVKNQP